MPRDLTPGQLSVIDSLQGYAAYLLEFDVDGTAPGTVRMTTAPVDIYTGGNTFIAGGNFITFDDIKETIAIDTAQIRVNLSGVSTEALTFFRNSSSDIVNRPLRIYRAPINERWEVIAEPIFVFHGFCIGADATMTTDNSTKKGSAVISMSVANQFAFFGRSKLIRTNTTEHQTVYPGDKGFEFVMSLAPKELEWAS